MRPNGGGAFTLLTPYQALHPAPYALDAPEAGVATLADGVTPGVVGLSELNTSSVDTRYMNVTGDTMTGTLNLPANGLVIGGSQLVLAGGLVGIGTSNPRHLLDLCDTSYLSAWRGHYTEMVHNLYWGGSPSVWRNTAPGPGTLVQMYGASDEPSALSIYVSPLATTAPADSPANLILGLRVINNGSVGIGTTAPAAKLEVQGGPIKATGGLIIETCTEDPENPVTGQIWLPTDIAP